METPNILNQSNTASKTTTKKSYTHIIPTILVCNIRSLAPKIDELEFISNINNADVLCITETWLSEEISDNYIQITNFNLFRKDRPTGEGEVAIYVKSYFQCKTIYVDDSPGFISEIIWQRRNGDYTVMHCAGIFFQI